MSVKYLHIVYFIIFSEPPIEELQFYIAVSCILSKKESLEYIKKMHRIHENLGYKTLHMSALLFSLHIIYYQL